MTLKLIRCFLQHERPVSEEARMKEFGFSSCQTEGSVQFASGDEATWLIWREGIGLMVP